MENISNNATNVTAVPWEESNYDFYGNKKYFTPETLEAYLDSKLRVVKMNDITKQIDVGGMDEENAEFLLANLPALIYSELQGRYRGCNLGTVSAYLDIIASRYAYNPVRMLLDDYYTWDGEDHLSALYDILGIGEDDPFSRVLIHKWLMQCIALQYNEFDRAFGADGVLVLTGPQGIGKTSFFRKLALVADFFKEGVHIDFRDKDTYIRATSCWICELGELESTLRKDVEKLKAFITQPLDEYRLPYARGNTRTLRRTSLCGTCNSDEFLIDQSGNRRFWSVPVTHIDLAALSDFNAVQLWKQIQVEILREGVQSFRLTAEEQRQLAERNTRHEKKLKAQAEIEDILNDTSTRYYKVVTEYMTVSEFKEHHSDMLRSYSVQQIGQVLDRLGYKAEQKKIDGKVKRLRLLPYREYNSPKAW